MFSKSKCVVTGHRLKQKLERMGYSSIPQGKNIPGGILFVRSQFEHEILLKTVSYVYASWLKHTHSFLAHTSSGKRGVIPDMSVVRVCHRPSRKPIRPPPITTLLPLFRWAIVNGTNYCS